MENREGRKQYYLIGLFVFFAFIPLACVRQSPPPQKAKDVLQNPDAKTDNSLGVLSKQGPTEVEKKLEELKDKTAEEKALQDLRRREREEEEGRIYRSVIEDRIRDETRSTPST